MPSRTPIAAVALFLALALVPAAAAKLSLQFDRTSARPGERVNLTFGKYFTNRDEVVHVYLVRASIIGQLDRRPGGVPGPPLGPLPRLPGVVKIGQTTSGSPGFAFRVPTVRAGRYAAAIWCSTCSSPFFFVSFPGTVPEDAYVRSGRTLLRVVR